MKLPFAALRLGPLALVSACGVTFAACGGANSTDIAGAGDADGGGLVDGAPSGAGQDGAVPGTDGGGGGTPDAGVTDASLSCVGATNKQCGQSCVDTQTDDANCGGCGIVCNTGCALGVCALISPDAGAPPPVGDFACLAVDPKNVYVANGRPTPNGVVYKVPLNGGAPTIIQASLDIPHGIASDGNEVYWANNGSGDIWKASANGGGMPGAIVNGQNRPIDLVVSAGALYWLNAGDGTVMTADKNGANVTKIAGPSGAAASHPGHLRVSATKVYFTDSFSGVVNSAPLVPNSATTVVASASNARFLDIDSTDIFFVSGGAATSAVNQTPLAGPTVTPVALNQTNTAGVALDGAMFYWANSGIVAASGTINRAKKDGSGATPLAMGQSYPQCIALDATSIYWVNIGTAAVSKTGK